MNAIRMSGRVLVLGMYKDSEASNNQQKTKSW